MHGRIVAVVFLELDRQAFGEIARANSRRIEGLENGQHGLDFGNAGAEFLRGGGEIAAQISGIVDEIDQVLTDHALHRIGDRQRELFAQPIRQRGFGGDEGFEIVLAVVAAAGAGAGPFRIGGRAVCGARRHRLAVVVVVLAGASAGRVVMDMAVQFELAAEVAGGLGADLAANLGADFAAVVRFAVQHRLVRGCLTVGLAARLGFRAAVEQRVALELGVDIGDQIEIGELQQLDGLHQLRRHHQRLALPYLQSLRERHEYLWRMRFSRGQTNKLVRFLLISLSYIFDGVASLFLSGLRAADLSPNTSASGVFFDACGYLLIS